VAFQAFESVSVGAVTAIEGVVEFSNANVEISSSSVRGSSGISSGMWPALLILEASSAASYSAIANTH
jgi:hypothetical protein